MSEVPKLISYLPNVKFFIGRLSKLVLPKKIEAEYYLNYLKNLSAKKNPAKNLNLMAWLVYATIFLILYL